MNILIIPIYSREVNYSMLHQCFQVFCSKTLVPIGIYYDEQEFKLTTAVVLHEQ